MHGWMDNEREKNARKERPIQPSSGSESVDVSELASMYGPDTINIAASRARGSRRGACGRSQSE